MSARALLGGADKTFEARCLRDGEALVSLPAAAIPLQSVID
jgi:hypothetical protein